MKRRRRPSCASPDEVRITRTDDVAVIEHADPAVPTTRLRFGRPVANMTDAEILDAYNDSMAAQEEAIDMHDNVCVEIPPGRPQIRWEERSRQWVPRGDIVRCVIDDGGVDENGDANVTIHIDDHELTLAEFGRMLLVHAGWGMRLAFVPEEYMHDEPEVEVSEPSES